MIKEFKHNYSVGGITVSQDNKIMISGEYLGGRH